MNREPKLTAPEGSEYLLHLNDIAQGDAEALVKAERSYGNSWKRRGGVGAFMMTARKWDRLENAMTGPMAERADVSEPTEVPVNDYDIFARVQADPRSEGLIDDVRDLRRYLLLIEAELISRGFNPNQPTD